MKKLKKILLIILLLVPLVGCQNQKNEWKETYQLTYFYLKDCSNCQHFKKNVLPAIKKEFPSLEVITIFFRTTFKPFLSICRFYRLFLYF